MSGSISPVEREVAHSVLSVNGNGAAQPILTATQGVAV
jgi:hypothetical protein